MTLCYDESLADFEWWSGARDNAKKLTRDELEMLDDLLDDGSIWTVTQLNDYMWFNFADVCETLGLEYDEENDRIIREEEE